MLTWINYILETNVFLKYIPTHVDQGCTFYIGCLIEQQPRCWCPGPDGRTPKVCPPCCARLHSGPIQCHISCCQHPNPAGMWWHNHNTKKRKRSHYHEQSQRHNYNISHRKSSGTYPGRTRVKNILRDHQHHLQFGFTEKLSHSMAALVCTEVLANNKDRSQDTFVATVDVQKAFDSVWHDLVFRKMFFFATDGNTTWPFFAQLMCNISVCVRIGAERSRTVTLHQGVGQGRIPSTEQYKLHLNDLLCTLETSAFGSHIGPFYCGSPTCADDVMLLWDTSKDLQAQLNIITDYARRERYHVNPTKTTISEYPGVQHMDIAAGPLGTRM